MVEQHILDPEQCLLVVKKHFKKYANYTMTKDSFHMGYWWIEYANEGEGISVYFEGDVGGHFYIKISISGTKYDLWRFNKTVNEFSLSTKKNILYQLDVLDKFLLEKK